MKKVYALASVLVVAAASAFGQGQITVANYVPPNNEIVKDMFGSSTTISGTAYLVDLLYGSSSSTINQDAGLALTFRTGAGAGYWNSGSTTLANGYTGTVFFEVVVWQAIAGASWAAATGGGTFVNSGSLASTYIANGGTQYGASTIFSVGGVNGSSPTQISQGAGTLQPISLVAPLAVPEPGTLALAAMGGASLLLFRRRK